MLESKCRTCPYKLGLIKCKISPCVRCRIKKLKKNLFGFNIDKNEGFDTEKIVK